MSKKKIAMTLLWVITELAVRILTEEQMKEFANAVLSPVKEEFSDIGD